MKYHKISPVSALKLALRFKQRWGLNLEHIINLKPPPLTMQHSNKHTA